MLFTQARLERLASYLLVASVTNKHWHLSETMDGVLDDEARCDTEVSGRDKIEREQQDGHGEEAKQPFKTDDLQGRNLKQVISRIRI